MRRKNFTATRRTDRDVDFRFVGFYSLDIVLDGSEDAGGNCHKKDVGFLLERLRYSE